MKQKLLSILLAAVMALSLAVSGLAVGTTLTISAPDKLPEVGETFTVTVSISGNPGLCAAQFTLAFDQSIVSCERVTIGEVLSGTLSATNESASKGAIVACAATEAKTGDGVLSTYQFRVLAAGDPDFSLVDGVFSDEAGQTVTTNVEKSAVTDPAEQPSETESETSDTHTNGTGTQTSGTGIRTGDTDAKTDEADTQTSTEQDKSETTPAKTPTFSDVPETFWGYAYIEKAAALGLVTGNPDGTFAPQRPMTRAEFVTVLYRLSGETAEKVVQFTDVPADSWYQEAVSWAADKGYAVGDGVKFRPNGKITRQEVVTILYRYSGGQSGMEGMLAAFGVDTLSAFEDSGSVSDWAKDAVRWAVYKGLLTGKTSTTLAPLDSASRAEITTIFVRYTEKATN